MFDFSIISGVTAHDIIVQNRPGIASIISDAYLAHDAGRTVNPDSLFLRFPEKPYSRIIALPSFLGEGSGIAGIKWISSFPGNIEQDIPRASAALLLNDYETGHPFACLEASHISAARTAASAALAAEKLTGGRSIRRLAVVGAGVIARNILEFLADLGWSIETCSVFDLRKEDGSALAHHAEKVLDTRASAADTLSDAFSGADVVLFTTTAVEPYVLSPDTFDPGQLILNISLRDVGPELIAGAFNVLDDVDHCVKANTSPHLAMQKYGHRDFIAGTLADVILGRINISRDRPVIFSPFGLGVLDLAVGYYVYREAVAANRTVTVPDFFGEWKRW